MERSESGIWLAARLPRTSPRYPVPAQMADRHGVLGETIQHRPFSWVPGAGLHPGYRCFCGSSKRVEEVHQILLLLVGQADGEAQVVEIDRIQQGRRRAVVEVGRARRQSAQDRSFDLA